MKKDVIVDSDIITEYLKTGKGALTKAYDKYKMIICTVTYTQILASVTFEDQKLEKEVMDFVDKYFTVKDIDKKIALEASRIIRTKQITLAQAYLAALSKVESIELLTKDKKSFDQIEGVSLLDLEKE